MPSVLWIPELLGIPACCGISVGSGNNYSGRLIRQYFPKGTDFSKVGYHMIVKAQ
jgi:hypothetical protein